MVRSLAIIGHKWQTGFLLVWLFLSAFPGFAEEYKLGPGDRLTVRAVAWIEAERRFANWDVVSGEYLVQADGSIAIPLGGVIEAQGRTLIELAKQVSEVLNRRAGMIEPPAISIEISTYRPFYILGDVARPGSYASVPDLTVLQALAIAGGPDNQGLDDERDIRGELRDSGSLRDVLNRIARARAREARLAAELASEEKIAFPDTLRHPAGIEAMSAIMEEERAIYAAALDAQSRELTALEDLKTLLLSEVAGLERKLAGQEEQVELARQNLANLERLGARGLTRNQQITSAKRDLLNLEAVETDLQNNLFRARQRIAENERDIVDLIARRESRATFELQEVRAQLEDLATRRSTLQRVMLSRGVDSQTAELADLRTTFSVVRQGKSETEMVGQDAKILPGDVLTVRIEIVEAEPLRQ